MYAPLRQFRGERCGNCQPHDRDYQTRLNYDPRWLVREPQLRPKNLLQLRQIALDNHTTSARHD